MSNTPSNIERTLFNQTPGNMSNTTAATYNLFTFGEQVQSLSKQILNKLNSQQYNGPVPNVSPEDEDFRKFISETQFSFHELTQLELETNPLRNEHFNDAPKLGEVKQFSQWINKFLTYIRKFPGMCNILIHPTPLGQQTRITKWAAVFKQKHSKDKTLSQEYTTTHNQLIHTISELTTH